MGILAAARFQKGNPTHSILVVVPSDNIKVQWIEELAKAKVKADVVTMYLASRYKYECSLLIIDEAHKTLAPTLVKLFDNIKFKVILGLTATFERVDGREKILAKYAPVIDSIPLKECVDNGWLSKFVEYKVLIDPPDLEVYNKINREFHEHFAFFNNEFDTAMKMSTDWHARYAEAKRRDANNWQEMNKLIMMHAAGFSRTLQARKKFIYNHPKKIEIASLILQHRLDKKCITFSQTIAMAEELAKYSGIGTVYSAKDTLKKGRQTLESFKSQDKGCMHAILRLNEGFNDVKIAVGIVLAFNSSVNSSKQRLGRIIRANNPSEIKENFTLVLRGTQDEKWAQNSLSGRDFIVIDEQGLRNLLEGKEFVQKIDRPSHIMFNS